MTSMTVAPHSTTRPAAQRRVGYVAAIACNAVLLYVSQHLLEWGWPRFLTDDYDEVLPVITASLVVGIAVNAVYLVYDRGWCKALGDAVSSAISFVVCLRMLQVFPFDFSTYSVDWTSLTRVVLVFGLLGTGIAFVVEAVRLVTWPFRVHAPKT